MLFEHLLLETDGPVATITVNRPTVLNALNAATLAELDRAIAQVFPPAVPTQIKIHREFAAHFPPLLMQRGHLSEILVNLLQNAREALGQTGNVFVTADCRRDYAIEISVRDDGPGVPTDRTERIFEAYYTTKEKGTGLGLAIVKHNVELYGGTVRLESKSGHGAKFLLFFPAKALMKLSKPGACRCHPCSSWMTRRICASRCRRC